MLCMGVKLPYGAPVSPHRAGSCAKKKRETGKIAVSQWVILSRDVEFQPHFHTFNSVPVPRETNKQFTSGN